MRRKVSAVVIAHNEESNIERCLKSLKFCDEIIVVDSGSVDNTAEIAKLFCSQVYFRAWKGYAEQKNEANSLASNDWILSIDADEEVSADLQEEIQRELETESSFVAYEVPRKTIHLGRWIRHGGWYPNRLVRLFDRKQGRWLGGEVHEFWDTSGLIGRLHSDLMHYSFRNLSDQVVRNDQYSSLGARKLLREGKRPSLFKLLYKPWSKFIETYLLKCGFLDGYPGFLISVSAAYSVFLKWAKLWEFRNVEDHS